MRATMMAQIRREMSIGEGKMVGRAMVALTDRAQAGAMALPLTRLGYQVDTVENAEEGARLLEQGVYDLVVATRAPAAGGRESLYQRLNRLSPERRRRIFLVIVGDEFKTGEGTQAWAVIADLVIAGRDVPTADSVLLPALAERTRLYQVFVDARKRFEASAV
jgi:response regulator RpfG family c-di-GMP phosphodiesterase